MTPRLRRLLPAFLVLFLGLSGYWLVRQMAASPRNQPRITVRAVPRPAIRGTEAPREEDRIPDILPAGTKVEIYGSCRPAELIFRFLTDSAYAAFLNAVEREGIELVDQVDLLRAVRTKWGSKEDHSQLGRELARASVTLNKGALMPSPRMKANGGIGRQQAIGFGDQLLPWIGVTGDNSRWGSGVKVAVIDSGIVPHPGLPRIYRSVELFPFSDELRTTLFHGTSVASLIAGTGPVAPGIAPSADLISVRVIDDAGQSDALSVSGGILAAMNCGAEIINLSLGFPDDLPIVRDAVNMAIKAGIVVVASSGNEGLREASYPASYEGVIAVGAIEAGAERMAFSNLGRGLGLTAPGYGVNAAAPGDGYVSIGGTSASAPIVCGAIAATMSDGSGRRIPASEAVKIVLACADDEGLPGRDSEYGNGVVNLDRIMNRNVRGRYDAAITCQRLMPGAERIEVTLQNRGTETLVNSLLEITTPTGTTKINATTISPGEVESFTAPWPREYAAGSVSSRVVLSNGAADLTPDNNLRTEAVRDGW